MTGIKSLLQRNRHWANTMKKKNPRFFEKMSHGQHPDYFWISCSDSRIPVNQIIETLPGQIFVHRNIANVVVHSDLNCLSALQYAVEILNVKDIIVCGHYGCGGVQAALSDKRLGLLDNWLRYIKDVREKYKDIFEAQSEKQHWDILCELNTFEQALNVAKTTIVRDAWGRGHKVAIHAWVYQIKTGFLHDLKVDMNDADQLVKFEEALPISIAERFRK